MLLIYNVQFVYSLAITLSTAAEVHRHLHFSLSSLLSISPASTLREEQKSRIEKNLIKVLMVS
jgi:hypothetical protein